MRRRRLGALLDQRLLHNGHARRWPGEWWSRVMTMARLVLAMMSLIHMCLDLTFLLLYFE